MRSSAGSRQKKIVDEINITPLTDVFLVLLVIMMVVAPMARRVQNEIRPPEIVSGVPGSQTDTIIEIAKDGHYLVDGATVPAEQLQTVLKQAVTQRGQRQAAVRADRTVKSRWILDAMDAAQAAGFERMTVVGAVEAKPVRRDMITP